FDSKKLINQFQSIDGGVTVSVLSTRTYGDSPLALFRRGGGRGKFFPRGREGARRSAFTQPADSKAGSGNRPTVVRSLAEIGRPDGGGPVFPRLRAANFSVHRRCPPRRR